MLLGYLLERLIVGHDWKFLIVAALLCGLAMIVTLHIVAQAHDLRSRQGKSLQHFLAGITAGTGIWAAQFISLLAHDRISGGSFDAVQTSLALAECIGLITVGLWIAKGGWFRAPVFGGLVIGLAIWLALLANLQAFDTIRAVVWDYEAAGSSLALCLILSVAALTVQDRIQGMLGHWYTCSLLLSAVLASYFTTLASLPPMLSELPASPGGLLVNHANLSMKVVISATVLLLLTHALAGVIANMRTLLPNSDRPRKGPFQMAKFRFRQAVNATQILLRSPIIGFAMALIAVVWGAAFWQQGTEREADMLDLSNDAQNMSRIIGQNVERTANHLDTTLKYIRRSHERSGYSAPWASLVSDEYTNSALTVQIAAIDVHGFMITSSAMLYPDKKIDLSDREHFRALRDAEGDPLYISQPVTGRASGKKSVQFARRIFNKDRQFDGILVASLTTDYLTTSFGNNNLGSNGGIALFGDDGVVRAASGLYANLLGKPVHEIPVETVSQPFNNKSLTRVTAATGLTAVATRPIVGHPLSVRVVLHDAMGEAKRHTRWMLYAIGLTIATLMILYVASTLVYHHHIFQARIVRLAHFDPLTNIPNRTQFNVIVERAYKDRNDASFFALLLIDLDGFKFVNDTHGHPLGDQLLRAAAARLKASLRPSDHLARLGGDEFAVIQSNAKSDHDAVALASRLCRILSEPFEIEGFAISVGASIGIATSRDARDSRSLLKAADLALYEAKAAGRGTCKLFDQKIEAAFHDRRRLERDLRIGLEREQFVLYYQPIINIQSGEVSGYEALIRWNHPDRGLLAPGHFIAVAEESGLILPLGKWIIKQACNDVAGCPSGLSVAVNCSALQFKCVDFVDTVSAALRDSGLGPDRLVLEITESILMSKDQATLSRLNELRKLGVGLSLDDFGTGYSSLSYVMSYPFGILKIDRSFTSQLCQDIRGVSVVKAICALAGSLDMKAVAEGVETQQQLEALRALGCNFAQGYYFSKPKPAAEILIAKYAHFKPVAGDPCMTPLTAEAA